VFEDSNGYIPLPAHLAGVGLSNSDLTDCDTQTCPLGMDPPQFTDFKSSLVAALVRDGLTPNLCDLRLKGSSSVFYSGWHKLMPYHREVQRDVFKEINKRDAKKFELADIEIKLDAWWPNKFLRPIRRPFDAMRKIGFQFDLSDYDVQVSSNEIEARVMTRAAATPGGVPDLIWPKGKFFKKSIVELEFPELAIQWPSSQGKKLGRGVTVAAFSALGPPDETTSIGHLSSHFRWNDWML
jgi:hypothetical protein